MKRTLALGPSSLLASVMALTMFSASAFAGITQQPEISGLHKVDLAVDVNRDIVYVQASFLDRVEIVDSKTGEKKGSIYVGKRVKEIELAQNGDLLILASNENKDHLYTVAQGSDSLVDISDKIATVDSVKNLKVEENGMITVEGSDLVTHEPVVLLTQSSEKIPVTQLQQKMRDSEDIINIEQKTADEKSEAVKEQKYTPGKAAGFTAGLITGLGFAYRQFFANGWGYHVGFGGIGDKNSIDANIGAQVMKVLDETSKARFYLLSGVSTYYSKSSYTRPVEPYDPNDPSKPTEFETISENRLTYNVGVGLGLEWAPAGLANKGVSFSVELPLLIYFDQLNDTGVTFGGLRTIPAASIIYYFSRN